MYLFTTKNPIQILTTLLLPALVDVLTQNWFSFVLSCEYCLYAFVKYQFLYLVGFNSFIVLSTPKIFQSKVNVNTLFNKHFKFEHTVVYKNVMQPVLCGSFYFIPGKHFPLFKVC